MHALSPSIVNFLAVQTYGYPNGIYLSLNQEKYIFRLVLLIRSILKVLIYSLAREGPIIPLANVTFALRIRKTN